MDFRLASRLAVAFAAGVLACAAGAQAEDWSSEARKLTQTALAPAPGLRAEVEVGRLDPRLKLAPCAKVEPYLPPGFVAWGRTRVGLRCLQGPTHWNVYLPVTVKVFGRALVAAAAMPAASVLTERDVVEAEVDLAAGRGNAVLDPREAIGRHLVRALMPGESLRETDLRARQWFGAGETVRIVAVGSGFAVHGEGQAITPGLDGAAARVRIDNGRIVTGTAVGERMVEIKL
ncbi:MAG TPA: flagellar basal body P-ring formation chaperone FlgA [Methylibium sp.]|uniref:flagellar basal body P-ring formation chaperone FlgA n=1 Tax=Methylibium sp. TaxID=2067992 RepID=UPI002DBD4FEC|nr:flagellar basal body P-ring formation chaperone FlgA [Methylibium sp.]HEU4457979.1 flagellar basal body P-ring formation chaperone FlgA [Methylibium sp.]